MLLLLLTLQYVVCLSGHPIEERYKEVLQSCSVTGRVRGAHFWCV